MHIAQLLFAHAGQAERELQIPVADLGESIGSLAMPFDMVFLDQKNLKGAMELHLVTVVEPDAGAMGDAEISEALSDVDPALREGSAELPPRPTEPVDGVQKKLPEVTAPGRLMADVAAQGDSKPTERSLSGEPNLTAATAVSSEPAPLPAEKWLEAVPAWYLRPTGMPEEIEGTPQKHAETEAPKALAGDAGENSTAEYVVPTDQTLATASGQQVANDVPALIAELPRAAPRLDILDIGRAREALSARTQVLSDPNLQSDRMPELGIAATATQVPDIGTVADTSRQVLEHPEAMAESSQGKIAAPLRPGELQNAGAYISIPVAKHDQQKSSPRAQAEELKTDTPAPRPATEPGARTVPVSDMLRQTPLPLANAPWTYTLAQEAERPVPDDIGFRVVEQVSSSAGDLRPAVQTRGTEVPRVIMAQIAEIVRQQPDRPVELTLSPEELGRLRMSFQSEGSTMHVVLSFERPDTLDLMRRHIDQLAQDMRASGMSDVSFTFQQQTSEGGGGTHSEGGSAKPSHDPQVDRQSVPEDPMSRVLTIAGRTGVDIRV